MAASDGFLAYSRHVNPALGCFLKVCGRDHHFVHGDGCTLTTASGQRFSDWMSGFGAVSFGHRPAFAREAIVRHLERPVPNLYAEALNPFAGELARRLVELAGPSFETCFFASSGSEAVEAALKTALVATGRGAIAFASGGYHGTTLGALGCMADGLYREPFQAALPTIFRSVPFGDAAALEAVLSAQDVAALVLEPLQMEGGAREASASYLREVRAVCDRHGTLLLLDEIQTGLGRTGRLFAFEHAGVVPDVLILGKALGAGMVPISAAVMGEGIWNRAFGSALKSEIHNSTFGGNALCAAVALAALEQAAARDFLENVRQKGELLRGLLERELAGRAAVVRLTLSGLLGGVKLRDASHPWASWSSLGMPELEAYPVSGALVVQRLEKRGVLAHLCGHDWSVVRIEPPLTVSEDECRHFATALGESVAWLEENGLG